MLKHFQFFCVSTDESRLMNNHSSNADSCGGQSTLPIDSSMDETDSGIAADDILLPASKAVSTESHAAIGPSCSAIEKLFKVCILLFLFI